MLNHYYNNLGSLYFTQADSSNLFNSNPRKYNALPIPIKQIITSRIITSYFSIIILKRLVFKYCYLSIKRKGYYEEYKNDASYSSYGLQGPTVGGTTVDNTDLIRRLWLDNNLYGTIFSLLHKTNGISSHLVVLE